MEPDRSDGERPHPHELPADAERDVHEVLRGEGMPAQWQTLPLRTQLEMMAGRSAVARHAAEDNSGNLPDMWKWADQGEAYLSEKFSGSDLVFHTGLDKGHVVLTVYRQSPGSENITEVFRIREKAEYFPSSLAVAKILMVM